VVLAGGAFSKVVEGNLSEKKTGRGKKRNSCQRRAKEKENRSHGKRERFIRGTNSY